MDWVKIGEVVHYFGRINVAIIELDDMLRMGDRIGFVKDNNLLFEQEVHSMQIDYEDIDTAEAGEAIGLQVNKRVRPGTEVYVAVE
jgi:translation elongation factor EF-1alpha